MESLVVRNCANGADENLTHAEDRLSDLMTVELFAHVASQCPGAFMSRWKLLFERCLQEPALRQYPTVTLKEVEASEDCQPTLDAGRLLRRWPVLVAGVWLVG